MESNRFYRFQNSAEENAVDLFVNGEIMDDESKTFYKALIGEDVGTSPASFFEDLKNNEVKKVNVYIDSYGGDVFAASSIYTALKSHNAEVIVKITGVAASAASVIAMAGDKVLMSKTAVMMIHNPATYAYGDHNEMEKAAETLNVIKESIINAYEKKTGMKREEISDLMEKETWMDYEKAIEYGFCDGMIEEENMKNVVKNCIENRMFVYNSLYREKTPEQKKELQKTADELYENELKNYIEGQYDRYINLLSKK